MGLGQFIPQQFFHATITANGNCESLMEIVEISLEISEIFVRIDENAKFWCKFARFSGKLDENVEIWLKNCKMFMIIGEKCEILVENREILIKIRENR